MAVDLGARAETTDIRLLCVDDAPEFRELLSDWFEAAESDITPVTASSPDEALPLLERESFDCVLSDYQMPRTNGIEFLETVRGRWPDLPFILVTGRGSEEVASEALAAGVTDYIPKSTTTSEFGLVVNRIENAVERYRARANYGQILDGVNDGVLVLDPEAGRVVEANRAAARMWRYSPDGIEGRPVADLVSDEWSVDVHGTLPDVGEYEWRCRTAEGQAFWAEVSLQRADIGGRDRLLLVARDVTRRKRRERSLDELLDSVQRLLRIESSQQIAEFTAETARTVLDAEHAVVFLHDADGESLDPVTAEGEGGRDDWPAGLDEDGLRDAYADGSVRIREDEPASGSGSAGAATRVFFPLDDRGVLVCELDGQARVEPATLDVGSLLATYATVVLDRVEREELLRERERTLSRQRDELADLDHVNQVIRNVNQGLVRVSSSEEIERIVPERLAAADRYDFAWLGSYEPRTRSVEPSSWAGVGTGELRGDPVSMDGRHPAGATVSEVIERNEVRVVRGGADDGESSTDGRHATASAYVPVSYQDFAYGVLVVSSEASRAFPPAEREVLAELGETVGHALSAAEWRQSRMGESVTEVELVVRDGELFVFGLSEETGREVEVTDTHVTSDGKLRLFARTPGADPGAIERAVEDHPEVLDVEVYGEGGDDLTCEFVVRTGPLVDYIAKSGIGIDRLTTTDGVARVLLQAPISTDVRDLVDRFGSVFDHVELVSRRERPASPLSADYFYTTVRERLTDRQREVLRVAYHAGYFAWPRRATGEEVAASLGISQPTFNEHVRRIERALVKGMFDDVPAYLQ